MGGIRAALLAAAVCALCAGPAAAEPGSDTHVTVDQTYTTKSPGAPSGIGYTGTYHAAGDESAPPPYMRRMAFYGPPGLRFDTTVPAQCTAGDAELSLRGPSACPEGSLLGSGTTQGIFYEPLTQSFEFDRFTHRVDIANNLNEQVIMIEAEGWSVVRGKINPVDNSITIESPTCFPTPPTGCATEHIVQLMTETFIPPYTTAAGSYLTTPPTCPRERYWSTTVKFWWSDGTTDSAVTTQPCSRR